MYGWSLRKGFVTRRRLNHATTEGKNQTLVGAIPFCGEYPGPRFEDKFRSANQIDGISIADGGKMADSKFVNKKTCEIRCYIYKQKCIQ